MLAFVLRVIGHLTCNSWLASVGWWFAGRLTVESFLDVLTYRCFGGRLLVGFAYS